MFKKWGLSAAGMLLTAAVILPGCGNKEAAPKEALQSTGAKALAMTSYAMKSKVTINDLTITGDASDEQAATTGQVVSMLKGAEITVEGVHQADPMQTELTLGLNLKGSMSISFSLPMIMTGEILYVQVPSIPFLPIPETLVGKYVKIDPKELAEQQGTEFNANSLKPEDAQKLSNELLNALLGEYDQEKYFKNVDPKDAGLPEDVKAKQVVRFQVAPDNVKEAVTIFVNQALPKLMEILEKDEYKDMLQLEEGQLGELKEQLQSEESKAKLDESLADLDKYLKLDQFELNTAIDKNDYPVYQDFKTKLTVNDPEQGMNVGLQLTATNQYSKIGEKQTFTLGIPKDEEVVTTQELQQQFGALSSLGTSVN